ncbi:MAG: DMT family transporter [Mesorhizobium sp.]|nr:DMT family transporter [Mesorhizobium sp.]
MAIDIAEEARAKVLSGIALTSLAYFLFSFHDAVIKTMVVSFAVWQILFFRSLTILIGCLAIGGRPLLSETANSPVIRQMFLRSFLIMSAWLCYYTAAKDLQLAELTTIYFAAPIMITVMAIFMLGEKVSALRWAAVLTGFVGVFIACDPATLGFTLPVLLVLGAAFLWGLSIVLLRKIAMKEKTIVQLMLNNGFFLITAGIPMLFFWQTPDLRGSLMLFGAGVIGGFAQFTLFEGMKRAPASVIAPFEYTSLVWAFLLGYLIWGDIPRNEVFVGAVLIVAAGLMTIVGESWRRPASAA